MSVSAIAAPGIEILSTRPLRTSTSHAMHAVRARDADGLVVDLVFKDLARHGLLPVARRPEFVDEPAREVLVYRELLAPFPGGTAHCFAAGEHWLLLERVQGRELFQVGERESWEAASAWLAEFHRYSAPLARGASSTLLRYDEAMCRAFAARAARFGAREAGPRRRLLERLLAHHGVVVDALASMPRAILHGDFSASNVIVGEAANGSLRVCPVDWETAAVGPPLLDLASLCAGWGADDRRAIASAYRAAAGEPDGDGFLRALDLCAVQLCVQWLGWAPAWTPPAEHRRDWLAEAMDLLDGLGL